MSALGRSRRRLLQDELFPEDSLVKPENYLRRRALLNVLGHCEQKVLLRMVEDESTRSRLTTIIVHKPVRAAGLQVPSHRVSLRVSLSCNRTVSSARRGVHDR